MPEVYVSGGAFISRATGRNHLLMPEYADRFECDGFEFMMYSDYYPYLDKVINDVKGVNIPVLHADKCIGDLVSNTDEASEREAVRLLDINMDAAERMGAKKVVVHCWGIPDSDKRADEVIGVTERLWEHSKKFAPEFLVENCVCVYGSPLSHLEKLAADCPDIGLIVDVRCSRFHAEERATMYSPIWKNNVRHLHISDFAGEKGDWTKLRPILSPGEGTVDWTAVREGLRDNGYNGTVTLESPSLRPDFSIDPSIANRNVRYIRSLFTK